jgi:hypothetical protein
MRLLGANVGDIGPCPVLCDGETPTGMYSYSWGEKISHFFKLLQIILQNSKVRSFFLSRSLLANPIKSLPRQISAVQSPFLIGQELIFESCDWL